MPPVCTEWDWLFLTGHPREKALSLWLAVVFVELVTGYYFLPYGLGWFVGALLLTA